jgi:hypothetical protein
MKNPRRLARAKAKKPKLKPVKSLTAKQRLALEIERELDQAEQWRDELQGEEGAMGFVFVVDKQDSTCEECLSYEGEMYALGDPDMPKLPIHPNCNCRLEPFDMG